MAGLPEYLGMGFGIAALYIGVKYGPQIIHNIQGQAQPAQAQTPSDQTSTAPASQTPASQGDNLDEIGQPVYNIPGRPRHQNDTGTLRRSSQERARHITQPPIPSGGPQGIAPITRKRSHQKPLKPNLDDPNLGIKASAIDAQQNCVCKNGVWVQSKPGQPVCDLVGEKCTPTASAYLGYFDGYEIPTTGPQWRQTIPNRELVASQGMATSRIKRALAAGNHDFMPGGFVLSEASVRRGVNNVYSAGT